MATRSFSRKYQRASEYYNDLIIHYTRQRKLLEQTVTDLQTGTNSSIAQQALAEALIDELGTSPRFVDSLPTPWIADEEVQ